MVKIPSLDELKKMGSGLIDSAKTVKFSEVVDKVKLGIDSVSNRNVPLNVTDEAVKDAFQGIVETLNELAEAQATQLKALKKAEKQLEELAKIIEANQRVSAETSQEEKPHES